MYNKPDCKRCGSNANVVEFGTYWRCAFCGNKWPKKTEQPKLNFWLRGK